MKVKICLIILIIVIINLIEPKKEEYVFKENNFFSNKIIGHAMFGIDGITYTNSKEAFLNGYKNGLRVFEIDLELTSDDKLVLVHDWNDYDYIPSSKEFLKQKIKDKYTTLNIENILLLLKIYPDIWIITDSKYIQKKLIIKEFKYLVESAKKLNLVKELDRFVIQLYYQDMYNIVESIYHFNNYLYTMYVDWEYNLSHFEEICKWGEDKLRGIVLSKDFYNVNLLKIVNKHNLDLYLHTVNDIFETKRYFKDGVKGIYSDFITDL